MVGRYEEFYCFLMLCIFWVFAAYFIYKKEKDD